jgi:hypothetical protein
MTLIPELNFSVKKGRENFGWLKVDGKVKINADRPQNFWPYQF